ncbi:MAG: IS200/IS605 family transposase [Thermaerobacter sp.]|nr:IS200/IS605 family transposase [Thermaerobacter sp.]
MDSRHHVTFDGTYHIGFCPTSRRNVLVNQVDTRLKKFLTTKAPELQTDSVEMEGMPDHVYLLVQCDPQCGIHPVVKPLQGHTAPILRQVFPCLKRRLPALTVDECGFGGDRGAGPRAVGKRYIAEQKGK